MSKKLYFGLKDPYYAVITGIDETTGEYTYDTPKPFGCPVNVSITQVGDQTKFYCNDSVGYTSTSNQGYEGSMELAKVTDEFRIDVLGDIEDDNGTIVEYNNVVPNNFALLFEVGGVDTNNASLKTRFAFYNCTATRPGADHNTKTETIDPDTQTLEFTADPREDGVVRAYADEDKPSFEPWFDAVYEPVVTVTTP